MAQLTASEWLDIKMRVAANSSSPPAWLSAAAHQWLLADVEFASRCAEAKRQHRELPVTVEQLLEVADSDEQIMAIWQRLEQGDESAGPDLASAIRRGCALRSLFSET